MDNIKQVFQLNSALSIQTCDICGKFKDKNTFMDDYDADLTAIINHYLQDHNCKLLFIGSNMGRDGEGELCHHTKVIIGSEIVHPPLPEVNMDDILKLD